MQCFFDQLIGDMRPIGVAGVDVIDSEPNDLAQDCDRSVVIFWWPEYMWTSELHGAIAHASQDQIIGKLECAAGQGGGGHRFQIRNYELRTGPLPAHAEPPAHSPDDENQYRNRGNCGRHKVADGIGKNVIRMSRVETIEAFKRG